MTSSGWVSAARQHMRVLCAGRDRRPGSAENQASTAYAASVLRRLRWDVCEQEFPVVGWSGSAGFIRVGSDQLAVHTSPYALGVDGEAALVICSSVDELRAKPLGGAIVVLHGALTAQPLTPKGFPFYQVDEHVRVVNILETSRPLAVVAVTGMCPEMAGAVRPFPLIEDGDFLIPAGHVDEREAGLLLQSEGRQARIRLEGRREEAHACNVIARRGRHESRITVVAHIDSKVDTPGALDNAAGVAVVLLLAQMLDPSTRMDTELLLVNGEDYFNAAGEVEYLKLHGDDLAHIALAVNVDGAGYRRGRTAFSLYGCDERLTAIARAVLPAYDLLEGPQWWQSDHTLFAMRGRPAIALTSELQDEVLSTVIHSPNDTLEQVDPLRLVHAAEALCALLHDYERPPPLQ